MKRHDLDQLRALIFEMRSLSIEMLRPKRTSVVDTVLDYRHDPKGKPLAIAGLDDGQAEFDRLEKKLAKKRKEQAILIDEMETWIDKVPDPEMRTIIRMYYRDGLRQGEIAEKLGYDQSVISRRIKAFWMAQK